MRLPREFSGRASLPFQPRRKIKAATKRQSFGPQQRYLCMCAVAAGTGCGAHRLSTGSYLHQAVLLVARNVSNTLLALQRGAGPSPDTRVTGPATAVVQGVTPWTRHTLDRSVRVTTAVQLLACSPFNYRDSPARRLSCLFWARCRTLRLGVKLSHFCILAISFRPSRPLPTS